MRLSPLILRRIRFLFVFCILSSNQAEIAMCVNKTPHAAIYVLLLRGKDSLQKIIKNLSPITHSPTRDFSRARARARGLLACFVLVLYLVFTCFRCPQTQ